MPTVYLKKELYDTLVHQGKDPSTVVNDLVEQSVKSPAKNEKKETKHA